MDSRSRVLVPLAVLEAVLIVLVVIWLVRPHAVDGAASDPGAEEREAPAATREPVTDVADGVREDVADVAPEPEEGTGPTRPLSAEVAVLYGRVVDAAGSAVPEARLSVFAGDGSSSDRIAGTSLRRDAGGRFAVPGLAPGSYRLQATATGFRERTVGLEVPAGVDRLRQDLVLERSWELKVRIDTPQGEPLHLQLREAMKGEPGLYRVTIGAVATIDPPPPGAFPATGLRDTPFGVGRWFGTMDWAPRGAPKLPERYAGLLELPEDRPMYVSAVLRDAVLATERVEAGQEEVVLVVPLDTALGTLCTVRLQVVDAVSGEPVPGARVDLSDTQSGGGGQPAGEDGRIELRRQRPGELELSVRVPDRASRGYRIDLAPGADVDLGAVPVFETVGVPVRFEGVADDVGLSVGLQSLDPPPHPALRSRALRYGERKAGDLSLQIAVGRYRLTAKGAGLVGAVEFDTAALSGGPVSVPMQEAAALRIVPPAGPPVELALVDPAGRAVFRRWITWTSAFDVTLAPGSYIAEITRLDGPQTKRAVTVTASGGDLDLR